MKVLNLQCAHQHDFEGWFASEDDFHQQLERGLLSCPLCGDAQVRKMLSAPRLNLGRTREETPVATPAGDGLVEMGRTAPGSELQGRLLRAVRELMSKTEDVGERFADEARAMHHGELEQRNIRGRTTPEVAMELIEEGIEVMPLPTLPALKETLQ
ncbi:DUF1178 family protein [Hydrogenophaga flava]|uniref:DUF1178 family protein n=1 Tax=Hydrogenophaga flava TaxID=65657 RepID=UPI0008252156|nr:DUF1178 family protein [Hydrogenophaga flava]